MSETRDLRRLTHALENWFQDAARALPWRSDRSGYHALVSEAMLQQTQVARVVDSFNAPHAVDTADLMEQATDR